MAQFSPIRFVRQAARNSPWIVIAVAVHAVIIAVMSLIYMAGNRQTIAGPTVNISLSAGLVNLIEPPTVPERKAPPTNAPEEITDPDHQDDYVPSDLDPDLSLPRGDPDSNSSQLPSGSTSIGVGNAPGFFGSRPSTRTGRGDGDGPVHGRGGDKTQSTEKAVLEGLIWLSRHQLPDGSWNATALPGCCVNDKPCVSAAEQFPEFWHQGLTGLSLLAFLGAGYNFDAKQHFDDNLREKKVFVGEVVKDGLKWLKNEQQPDGSFGPDQHVYNQAICALALSEAYGQSKNMVWKDPAQRAIDWLVRAQKSNPDGTDSPWGWRYHSRADVQTLADAFNARKEAVEAKKAPLDAMKEELEAKRAQLVATKDKMKPAEFALSMTGIVDQLGEVEHAVAALRPEINEVAAGLQRVTPELYDSDLSVTTWVVMAFKSAEAAGLVVPRAAYQGAKDFVLSVSTADGQAGYLTREGAGRTVSGKGDNFDYHVGTMGSLSMLCRTFIDHDIADPFLEQAAKQLMRDLPDVSRDKLSVDYYYWYYASLALNQFDGPDSPRKGGRYWEQWNHAMQVALLGTQDETQNACSGGGWIQGDRWALNGGPVYATALNVLTLEVYYRYPNAFGSGTRFTAVKKK